RFARTCGAHGTGDPRTGRAPWAARTHHRHLRFARGAACAQAPDSGDFPRTGCRIRLARSTQGRPSSWLRTARAEVDTVHAGALGEGPAARAARVGLDGQRTGVD